MTPHSATATTQSSSPAVDVCYALASIRKGCLLSDQPDHVRSRLEALAATLPDLFGTVDPNCFDRISERLGSDGYGAMFDEILLLSEQCVQVIQPLSRRRDVALLAVSSAVGSIGLVLSAVRAHVAGVEGT